MALDQVAIKTHFSDYLSAIYGQVHHDIEILSGGVVNHTVRAKRTGNLSADIPSDIIIKYAPPFIAGLGPDAPFSQDRQKAEAAALVFFSDKGPLKGLPGEAGVQVPRVIRHDQTTCHLVLGDLGSDTGLAGHVSWFGDLGRALGHFFARLHSPETMAAIRGSPECVEGAALLEHQITTNTVREYAVDVISQRLTEHGGMSESDARGLHDRVLQDFTRDSFGAIERAFSLGDAHPGCILLSRTHMLEGIAYPAVIDWEFATITGRGANGDMPQLLSYYHLFLLSHSPETGEYKVVREFVSWMCREYAQRSHVSFDQDTSGPNNPRWEVFRSALILHGREMINQAVEWTLGNLLPKRDLVHAGVWYLERAGASVAEMLENQNLAILKDEKEGIMLSLFNLSW